MRRLSNLEVHLVAELLPRPLRAQSVARRLCCPVRQLEATACVLVDRGILTQTKGGAFVVEEWAQWLPSRVETVEAKLRDWRAAVLQAEFYRGFSDSAYVAMPSSLRGQPDIPQACRRAGVGMLLVSPDGEVTRRVSPEAARGQRSRRRNVAAVRLLQQFLKERLYYGKQ